MTHRPPHASDVPRARTSRVAAIVASRAITRAPEAALLGLVALALAAGTTVSLGIHAPWTTLPLALVVGWLLWRAVPPVYDATRAAVTGARVVVSGTAAWIAVGFAFASQYVVVNRDPGFLALSGLWLTDHSSTDIPARGAVEAAATQANMLPDASQAWNLAGDVIQPQGAKMLPGLLSVGGWIGGVQGVLWANVVVGGIGLLAVYVLARRMMGPLAALVPAAVFGLTVSHLGLSRSPYSEPLTLVLIVAAVAWAWRGLEERRSWAMVAAGVASGATSLVRIDGAAYAVGVLLGVAAVALARGGAGRRLILAFAVPQAAMVAAGYGSLAVWSAAYLERLADQARSIGAVYAAVVLAVLAAVLAWGARDHVRARSWQGAHREALARGAATVTIGALVVLASRPLWMTDHRGTTSTTDQFTNKVVASFQYSAGYPIDGTRTYAEHTLTWMSYYVTWPLMAIAALGFGLLAYHAVSRNASALVFLGAVAAPSAIYVVKPEIVPDQIWAIRRFEPITMPGIAIAAGVGLWWLTRAAAARWPHAAPVATPIACVVALLLPVSTWVSIRWHDDPWIAPAFYVAQREEYGSLPIARALCDVIDGRPVVLADSSRTQYFGTIRVMCDVPEVLALEPPTPEALAQMRTIWGEAPIVLTTQPEWLWETAPAPVVSGKTVRGEYALQHITRLGRTGEVVWYAGIVEPDGSVTPVVPGA